jgi:hypothetical protein
VQASPLVTVREITWNQERFSCDIQINGATTVAQIEGNKTNRKFTVKTNSKFPANRQISIWLANKSLSKPVTGHPAIVLKQPNTRYSATLPGASGSPAGFWVSDAYVQ